MNRLALITSIYIAGSAGFAHAADGGNGDISEEVVRKVDPAVVAIHHERATGSGFIISEDGYILSNGHVSAGNNPDDPTEPAKAITVVLSDETKYKAKVLGFSLNPDVALLKIEPRTKLVPVEIADVSLVQIGQPCFAVGTPHGLKRTFSRGILSNVDRTDLGTFTKVFQTDAAINPGNSGGPLFDAQGRVLGLNTYASRGANNLGFTIPIDYAMIMKDHFLAHGRFIRSDLPVVFLGELYDEMQQALGVKDGVLIHFVKEGSHVDNAGLQSGDILVGIDGSPVAAHNKPELLALMWELTVREPGSPIELKVLRGAPGKTKEVTIKTKLVESDPPMTTRRFKGEIPTSRIDALGLSYKQLVDEHRVAYGLTDSDGVLMSKSVSYTAAFRAGISNGDVITHVEGKAVTSPASFEAELHKHLVAGTKAIDLTIDRKGLTYPTVLKPFYDLAEQRIVAILPKGKAERVDQILRELTADGASVTLAVSGGKTETALPSGWKAPVDIGTLSTNGFDRLVLVEGEGAETLYQNKAVLTLVKDAADAKLIVAAEGASALTIPAADKELLEKKITTRRDLAGKVSELKGTYTGQDVESGGKFLTSAGDGKPTTREFLKKFRTMR